jgi:hypothetical protein
MRGNNKISRFFGFGTKSEVYQGSSSGYAENVHVTNGEKTHGNLPSKGETYNDYYGTRKTALLASYTNPNVGNVLEKFNLWTIGTGLTMQMSPMYNLIGDESDEMEAWCDRVDALFKLWSKSRDCDLNKKHNLAGLCRLVNDNAKIAGDVLCIQRYDKKNGTTIEIVDGGLVETPPAKSEARIFDGVELNDSNQVIAFHVNSGNGTFSRIPAYNKNGQETAFLVYGRYGRLSSVRGKSSLLSQLEYANKLDKFLESVIKNAAENANFIATIKHGVNSNGVTPMKTGAIQTQRNVGATDAKPAADTADQINGKIAKISEGAVLNLGVDQEFQRYNGEGSASDSAVFFKKMQDTFYSNMSMPPSVARDQFEGSYSSARMEGKTWEQKFLTDRETLIIEQFLDRVSLFYLENEIAAGNIELKGYFSMPKYLKQAYLCRVWRGIDFPVVDPLKEIKAIREKLGPTFANVPLITLAAAIDELSGLDSSQVISQTQKELKKIEIFNEIALSLQPQLIENQEVKKEEESDNPQE